MAGQFAKHRAVTLLLGCRSGEGKGVFKGRSKTLSLELLDLDSVQQFAREVHPFLASGSTGLRLLINNAGVLNPPEEGLTKNGATSTWQTNFLAPFLLTEMLAKLREAEVPASRCMERPMCVVQVASGKEHNSLLDEREVDAAAQGLPGSAEYADSKRALLLWTSVRAQSLAFKGHIFAHAASPGKVDTRLGLYWMPTWMWLLTKPVRMLLFETVAEGALRVARAALQPQATRKFGTYLEGERPSEDLVFCRMPEKQLSMRLVRWAMKATELEFRSSGRRLSQTGKPLSHPELSRLASAEEDKWSSLERRLSHGAQSFL